MMPESGKLTPKEQYEIAFEVYEELKLEAIISGSPVCNVSKISDLSGVPRGTFYKPNFGKGDDKYNQLFIALGESISNFKKNNTLNAEDSLLAQRKVKIEELEVQLKNAQAQTAAKIKEILSKDRVLAKKDSEISKLAKKLDELAYLNLADDKPKQKHFITTPPKILSPDHNLYVDGRYYFDDRKLRNAAWSSTRYELKKILSKKLPTRVYILTGLPNSGKSHWCQNHQFLPDMHSIVIDCCNLTKSSRQMWAAEIKQLRTNSEICLVIFDTPIEVIQERNNQRSEDKQLKELELQRLVDKQEAVEFEEENYFDMAIVERF